MFEICAKSILGGNIYVHSKFSCVHSSQDLCVRARAQLRGNIDRHYINSAIVTPLIIPVPGQLRGGQAEETPWWYGGNPWRR